MNQFRRALLLRFACAGLCAPLSFAVCSARAARAEVPSADLAFTYVSERSLLAGSSQNFWMQGGAAELGVNAWRGWGVAADITGTHSGSVASGGVPLSVVTATFGPRYRWRSSHTVSVYGEGLLGEANGFHSLFPNPAGAQSGANSMAVQVGGGLDLRLHAHVAIRAVEAAWVRTQLPNGTNNAQNTLKLGLGFAFRFGR